jgi:hypothetical protein
MSHDGCEEVTWKGQAFPYLMHHPKFLKTESYGSARAAAASTGHSSSGYGRAAPASGGDGSDTMQRVGGGVRGGWGDSKGAQSSGACGQHGRSRSCCSIRVSAPQLWFSKLL